MPILFPVWLNFEVSLMIKKSDCYSGLLVLLLLSAAYITFFPAINGPFLLDDIVHFPNLSAVIPIDDFKSALYYVTHAGTSATGRPLSFLALLIEDHAWPTDSTPYKHTNLLLHLLNACLVFLLSRLLLTLFFCHRYTNVLACLLVALWMFHPMHISTMMLTIQRMTLLMALITLSTLICFLKLRLQYEQNGSRKLLLYMSVVIGFGVAVGVLFKESAISIVFYVIAIELFIFRQFSSRGRLYKAWFVVVLLAPIFLVVLYYLINFDQMASYYAKREFDMWQRILSEQRVLVEYLANILIPSVSNLGPYHDDYVVSKSLFEPLTTAFALLFWLGLGIGTIVFRKLAPLLGFCFVWFFGGHMLESTVLPLELYFEHRNYIPMVGVFFVVVVWFGRLHQFNIHGEEVECDTTTRRSPLFKGAIACLLCGFVVIEVTISRTHANLWGDSALQANVWAYEHPNSPRAQSDAVNYWVRMGDYEKANEFLVAQLSGPLIRFAAPMLTKYIYEQCFPGWPSQDVVLADLLSTIDEAVFEHASIEALKTYQELYKGGACRGFDTSEYFSLIDSYANNRMFAGVPSVLATLYKLKSDIYLQERNFDEMIRALIKAYESYPLTDTALAIAYYFHSAGLDDESLHYIKLAKYSSREQFRFAFLWKDEKIKLYPEGSAAVVGDK